MKKIWQIHKNSMCLYGENHKDSFKNSVKEAAPIVNRAPTALERHIYD